MVNACPPPVFSRMSSEIYFRSAQKNGPPNQDNQADSAFSAPLIVSRTGSYVTDFGNMLCFRKT
jgi:hypothetical protein